MRICLNGEFYELKSGTGVKRIPLVEWPDNMRFDGQQQRKDRNLLSSWAIDSWENGLGLEKINVNLSSNDYRLWDVDNCDTRHASHIVRSPAFNTCTIIPSRGDVDVKLVFDNNLYFTERGRYGSIATEGNSGTFSIGIAYRFSGPLTIGSYRHLAEWQASNQNQTGGSVSFAKEIGGKIVAAIHAGYIDVSGGPSIPDVQQNKLINIPTLGSMLPPNYFPAAPYLGTYPWNIMPQIEEMTGTIHIMGYQNEIKTVNMWVSSGSVGTAHIVASIGDLVGSILSPLMTDGVTMYANLPKGIYNFDMSPAVEVDTSRSPDLNCAQILFGQNLYFKNMKSVIKYDGVNTSGVGYDIEDGLPTHMWGEITAMCSTWKYIFAAVKGASYSHILAMDSDNKWQYYAKIPSMGLWVREMFLSNQPDNIDRLWCLFGNHHYPGYFLNPMVNPLQAATYSFVPTGYFSPPVHDGGLTEISAGYYDVSLTADGMGGSNIITILYGLNGDNPVTTLGIVATNSFSHVFGSPYGIEGYRIQPKFMLTGASGSGPVFREAILHYLKIPNERMSFEFIIDIDKSSRITPCPPEAIIGSLDYIKNNKLLMPFWYGQIATKNVKVLESPAAEDIEDERVYEGERKGYIDMKVSEIL